MNYYDTYDEIIKIKGVKFRSSLRNMLRAKVLDGLYLMDILRNANKELSKPRVQFIYIHHVFKDEEKALDNMIKYFKQNHEFISYSEAVERVLLGNIDKPYMSISFDDGLQNNLKAAEILTQNDVKACFFINPRFANSQDFNTVRQYCADKLHLPPVQFLSWNEIGQIQAMGHEIGSHSMEHHNLVALDEAVLYDDIQQSFEIIKMHCGEVKHFAFPYGRYHHFSETARSIVFKSGFISCASAERGCHTNSNNILNRETLCILRDHVLLNWNIKHICHFIINNSRNMNFYNNFFPYAVK